MSPSSHWDFWFSLLLFGGLALQAYANNVTLIADGETDTYSLISSFFGVAAELPDCGHDIRHIFQDHDDQLGRPVFSFHLHRDLDNDKCNNKTDRQRIEVKSHKESLVGFHGETLSQSWNFKLDAAFQPSSAFTHIHQLKPYRGNELLPVLTLTARKGSTNSIQIIHVDSKNVTVHLGSTPLAPFLGTWIHVKEETTFLSLEEGGGRLSIEFSRLDDGSQIYKVDQTNIDMWRDDTNWIRGKWGIYRSLNDIGSLRDEVVQFDSFCFAKREEKCA